MLHSEARAMALMLSCCAVQIEGLSRQAAQQEQELRQGRHDAQQVEEQLLILLDSGAPVSTPNVGLSWPVLELTSCCRQPPVS